MIDGLFNEILTLFLPPLGSNRAEPEVDLSCDADEGITP